MPSLRRTAVAPLAQWGRLELYPVAAELGFEQDVYGF
jgi:hypothetical protein